MWTSLLIEPYCVHLCQLKKKDAVKSWEWKRGGEGRELFRQMEPYMVEACDRRKLQIFKKYGIGAGGGERWEMLICAEFLTSVLRAVS